MRAAAASLLLLSAAASAEPSTMGFTVALDLSPRAIARVARLHDHAVLFASVSGEPSPAGVAQADHGGHVNLAFTRATVPAVPGAVALTVRGLTAAKLAWVMEGSLTVRIQAGLERPTGPDWSTVCTTYAGPVPPAEPVHVACVMTDER